jgi:predicted ABC-type ATPase
VGERHPSIVILAGPNGAGKSTMAPALLQGLLHVSAFVNADDIARELSSQATSPIAAGRVMLTRIHALSRQRASFGFETTLASRSFVTWLADLQTSGYEVHVQFLWLPSAEFAIERVAQRVQAGGHDVPASTIRRRYRLGINNFFQLYEPIASTWAVYDASAPVPRLVAERSGTARPVVYDKIMWSRIVRAGRLK